MAPRAPSVKRLHNPLTPARPIVSVVNDSFYEIAAANITAASVGLKAFGLASLPPSWTMPFLVVPTGSEPTQRALENALTHLGIAEQRKFIVRSSGVEESMDSRGALDSIECDLAELADEIRNLREALEKKFSGPIPHVHWVVQQLLPVMAKGHLSNERRVAENKRDWIAEVEASAWDPAQTRPIPLRTWRDNRPPRENLLLCEYREKYIQPLTAVAKWAYERLIRVHFEWVWDGRAIYIVQADGCDDPANGIDPKQLVNPPKKGAIATKRLQLFREATTSDYDRYRKLGNARIYRDLGYAMVPFYVLDHQEEISNLIKLGQISEELRSDLEILVARPLVIRSDGANVHEELKQMLPRSEELRSIESAEKWLVEAFRKGATSKAPQSNHSLSDCNPCLIAHHFVPAMAAAWCQAKPDNRRVRIESLWGLPEGLYWYAYDAYDVDTQSSSAEAGVVQPKNMQIRERPRYKEHFVAPNADGNWVLHKTAAGPDWRRSIRQQSWIEEIAWTSRRIAAKAGHPVVVMWFVDVPPAASVHRVLPWYHEQWRADSSPHKAAPRRKLASTTDFVLRDRSDWEILQYRVLRGDSIVRIRVQPSDPDIVRDREFAEKLAEFAKDHQLVVELEGGILSHAYYMLSRAGCVVECADLDDYATEDFELEFHKLVRDKVPENIASRGETVTTLRLEGAALIAALRRKLVEEALEVLDAPTTDEISEEIADVREVILSLMARLEISEADVEARRKRKLKARGAFQQALMLSKTAVAPSMGLREFQGEDLERNFISGTIHRTLEIPHSVEEVHVDKRVDAAGLHERQFTVNLPAHAEGYQSMRVPFNLSTPNGPEHNMVFELLVTRKDSDLRVRARVQNVMIQMELDLRVE